MKRIHTGPLGGLSGWFPRGLKARRRRLIAILVVVGVVSVGSIALQAPDTAWAKDYPSWSDVLKARNNEAAKKVEIGRLQTLIKQNQDAVVAAEAIATEKGEKYQQAQQAFDEANYKAELLQQQADASSAQAEDSKKQAGQMAAQLARTGGNDLSTTLFFNGDSATDLLSQLGMANKINQQSQGLYARAIQDQNTAQSLTDQATVAKAKLAQLADDAQKALEEAQAAAEAQEQALAEKQATEATLQAQLATLTTNKIHTESEYDAGVKAAAAQRAKELAEAAASAGKGAGGQISTSGWARPAGGHVVSGFGARIAPCGGCSTYHAGVDLAAGFNAPIYAAHAGTVTYAGWFGGYGNYISINHGDGSSTAYGHIVNGGILVHSGQQVAAGQQIARVGSTGNSTGPHLHFEVRINGSAINPVPFMAARGINF